MTRTTQEAQAQETRGVLAVVVMLLLAGVFTILFAAGHLSEKGQVNDSVEVNSAVVSESR